MTDLMTWPNEQLLSESDRLETHSKLQLSQARIASAVMDGLYAWDIVGIDNVVLLKRESDGKLRQACSATLLSTEHILTAAHCFCAHDGGQRFSTTRKSCLELNKFEEDDYIVYSPVWGFSMITAQPTIHELYDIDFEDWEDSKITADLAIARLAEPFQGGGAQLFASEDLPPRTASVSSGPFGYSADVHGGFFKADVVNSAGMITVGVTSAMQLGNKEMCARLTGGGEKKVLQLDTICRPYDGNPKFDGDKADVIACGGDSGGGLFALDSGANVLLGVVSNVQTGGRAKANCILRESGLTWSVDVRHYLDWIRSEVGDATIGEPATECGEALIPPGGPFVVGGSPMSVGFVSFGSIEASEPLISMYSSASGVCKVVKSANLGHCEFSHGQFGFVETFGRGGKVTICRRLGAKE